MRVILHYYDSVADGVAVKPYSVDKILFQIGQRYDVLVTTDQAISKYKIHYGPSIQTAFGALIYDGYSSPDFENGAVGGRDLIDDSVLEPNGKRILNFLNDSHNITSSCC